MYVTQSNLEGRMGSLTDQQKAYFTNVLSPAIDVFINRATGTKFGGTGAAEVYVQGSCSKLMVIPTMHTIASVTKLNNDGSETVLDDTSYVAYPRGETDKYALRNLNGRWDECEYKITGAIGYADIPADIQMVATELAMTGLTQNDNNYKSEKVGDWSVTYAETEKTLSSDSLTILSNYRRLSRDI